MGECGCSNTSLDKAFRLPNGQILAYDTHRGCEECDAGPGLTIYVFPDENVSWLWKVPIESFQPDEYGGAQGHGIPVPLFTVEDMIAAAVEIGETNLSRDGYRSVEDWLKSNGVRMMQDAMALFWERTQREARRAGP